MNVLLANNCWMPWFLKTIRIQFYFYSFLSFFQAVQGSLILTHIFIHCSQTWAPTSDGTSISDSLTRLLFTMTSFKFTTSYSYSLAVNSSRYLVIKRCYLVVCTPAPQVPENCAFTGSSFNALSATRLKQVTDSGNQNTLDSHSSLGVGGL